jgi:predicted phosphodiesterase
MAVSVKEIEKVISTIENNPQRLKNDYGDPGGLIDLSKQNHELIVIGDLHGSIENLKAIVDHEDNKKKLKKDKLILLIIGDGVHNDQVGQMLEMDSSLLVLEEVFNLFLKYKDNIIYIRGNHDTFDSRLAKSAIKQGLEFKNHLLEHRGEQYVEKVNEFFESLPVFVIGRDYAITHGGPVRHGATKTEVINIVDNDDFYHQLIWNRLHEFRGTPSLKEYNEQDIRKMNIKMNLPELAPFIVGHNPMWTTGDRTGIWKDIIGIKNHYIIYTNIGTKGPYLLLSNSEVIPKFAITN